MACWLAMGGTDDILRSRYLSFGYYGSLEIRGERSDDVSKWYRVKIKVEGGRVRGLKWNVEGLSGTIPSEIGALSAPESFSLN